MQHDLIERYIYAVTRHLPPKSRPDISRELHTLIQDMLEARCGAVLPTEKDIRVVLTELGSPEELRAKYDPSPYQHLIGPPYYRSYCSVLRIVLPCVWFGMTLAALLSLLDAQWYQALGTWIGGLLGGTVSAFGLVTFLFALLERRKVPLEHQSGLDNLPPVPQKRDRISRPGTFFAIGMEVLFTLLFLFAPAIIRVYLPDSGGWIPLFQAQVISARWYLVLPIGILGILRECVKLLEGSYTPRVLAATIVDDLLSAVLVIFWLGRDNLINPDFTAAMQQLFKGDALFLERFFAHFQYFFLGIFLFGLALDVIDCAFRTRSRR